MRRFGNRTLYVEVKDRFGGAGSFLGQATPTGIVHTIGAIPSQTIPNEIHIDMIIIRRPMALEVVGERWPVGQKAVNFKVTDGKGKTVVYADNRILISLKLFHQPLGNTPSSPIFT